MFSISDFQSSINSRGVMRNNRFLVYFNLPKYLQQAQQNGQDYGYGDESKLLMMRCEAAQIPGITVAALDQPRIGLGPLESMPHNVDMDASINLTFLVDSKSTIHKMFYDWINTIVNFQGSRGQTRLSTPYTIGGSTSAPFEVGYKDDYCTDLIITMYDNHTNSYVNEEGVVVQDLGNSWEAGNNPVLTVTCYRAYPKSLPQIDLAWADTDQLVKLTIPFAFTDYTVVYPEAGRADTAGVAIPAAKTVNFTKPKN